MKKIWNVVVLSIMLSGVFMPNILAQEEERKDVCLVYLTDYDCGDECQLADTFMNGLMKEYGGKLISITYFVGGSVENQAVFEAYRTRYGLPQNVPILLFGKDDYLAGRDSIYKNAESKILSFLDANGTNCPLESGYVAPAQLNGANLPGQPLVLKGGVNADGNGEKTDGKNMTLPEEKINASANNQNPLSSLERILTLDESAKESLLSLVIIVAVLFVVAVIVFFIWEKSQGNL